MKFMPITLVLMLFTTPLRADSVALTDAWVRATPPGANTAAAYLTITSDADDRLVGAYSESTNEIQIHAHVQDDGVMRMRRLDSLQIPARRAVVLAPGGKHLMMFGIAEPFAPGEELVITLLFERAGAVEQVFPVRDGRKQATTPS